jgi:hypothetical protein
MLMARAESRAIMRHKIRLAGLTRSPGHPPGLVGDKRWSWRGVTERTSRDALATFMAHNEFSFSQARTAQQAGRDRELG